MVFFTIGWIFVTRLAGFEHNIPLDQPILIRNAARKHQFNSFSANRVTFGDENPIILVLLLLTASIFVFRNFAYVIPYYKYNSLQKDLEFVLGSLLRKTFSMRDNDLVAFQRFRAVTGGLDWCICAMECCLWSDAHAL